MWLCKSRVGYGGQELGFDCLFGTFEGEARAGCEQRAAAGVKEHEAAAAGHTTEVWAQGA